MERVNGEAKNEKLIPKNKSAKKIRGRRIDSNIWRETNYKSSKEKLVTSFFTKNG